ncbi:exonuclease domain-containing protein [Haloechinothrix sp. LS1_15]|uniref:exonuclease domain-containing protein n=1 Tax=Haloechinothrix sp. LS1_15 TaxID=2652248 RepID=UPI002945EB1E|nr:exonuclease domain-containing protein [Haloechinothrix sp. LS1_15]MDV6012306.1 3'-5' exonuclease [Haloechinothrix sp. LS1_15]
MPDVIERHQMSRQGRVPARDREYTAIDFETTGMSPGHIVEIGAVRIRGDGTVLGELSTLVNPGSGVDPGPTRVHKITRGDLDDAPPLADVMGNFLDLCRDSVVVAHNLPFEARFLAREWERLRLPDVAMPGVCTLMASRRALRLPNYRLPTVTDALGCPEFAAHSALADARACANVIATLVNSHGMGLTRQPRFGDLPRLATAGVLTPRPGDAPVARESWMSSLTERLRVEPAADDSSGELDDAYLDLLGTVLSDGQVSRDEAQQLAELAQQAGMSDEHVREVHRQVVVALRREAASDGAVTATEVTDLARVAEALDVTDVISDLRPTSQVQTQGSSSSKPVSRQQAQAKRTRVLVLGRTVEADALRSAVLEHGYQLARNLTASVTHLVVDEHVPDDEPRRQRAVELGARVLPASAARSELGLQATDAGAAAAPAAAVPLEVPPASKPAASASDQSAASPDSPEVGSARGWRDSGTRSAILLCVGWVLIGIGAFFTVIAALALLGGGELSASITVFLLGLLIGWPGLRLKRRHQAR